MSSMDQLEMYMEGSGAEGLPAPAPCQPAPAPVHPVPPAFNPVAHGLDANFRLTRFAELRG